MNTQSTFTFNGKRYDADAETANVLRRIIPAAQATGDTTAVQAIFYLGLATGRITEK